MKAGRCDRSTMRGSAKAFRSRALKRPSRWQQFASLSHEIIKNMNIHETLKSWTFLNFHELSWTFINFHEKLFTKLQNHEILQFQGECAAIEHRCDPSLVKSWNLSCASFYDALLRRWVCSCEFGHGLFNTRRRQINYASPHKTLTAINWKTNLNVDTLLESKVATL